MNKILTVPSERNMTVFSRFRVYSFNNLKKLIQNPKQPSSGARGEVKRSLKAPGVIQQLFFFSVRPGKVCILSAFTARNCSRRVSFQFHWLWRGLGSIVNINWFCRWELYKLLAINKTQDFILKLVSWVAELLSNSRVSSHICLQSR